MVCEIVAVRGPDAARDVLTRLNGLSRRSGGAAAIAELGGDRALNELNRVPAPGTSIVRPRSGQFKPTSRLSIGQLLTSEQASSTGSDWPLMDCTGSIGVVHCGTLNNGPELRASLEHTGHRFSTASDSEVIPHVIEAALGHESTSFEAFQAAIVQLSGSWAIAALIARSNSIFVARYRALLTVRGTVGRCVIATDPTATDGVRGPLRFLEDGSIAELGTAWRWAGSPGGAPAPVAPVSRGSRRHGVSTHRRHVGPLYRH